MDQSAIVLGASISGLIGILAPFILPFVFKLIVIITKKELTSLGKQGIITGIAIMISLTVILSQFGWSGDIQHDISELVQFFLLNFVAVKGMIQTIYEVIVKGVPAIDEKLTELSQ